MKLIELHHSSMKQMKSAHLLILLLGMVSMECKNEANKSIKKISQVEIEKDSSYLYTHTLNSTTKKALETLGQTPMVEGNLGNQLTTFIKEGIYDYGEIFKFIELKWKNNSSELIQKSRTEIDELAKVMMLFPNMTIKMECYTDNNGEAKKLEKISQERVEYIKKEIVASGVSPERINIKGFGSKYPVGDNKIMEGQLINNRIEITILKLF